MRALKLSEVRELMRAAGISTLAMERDQVAAALIVVAHAKARRVR